MFTKDLAIGDSAIVLVILFLDLAKSAVVFNHLLKLCSLCCGRTASYENQRAKKQLRYGSSLQGAQLDDLIVRKTTGNRNITFF